MVPERAKGEQPTAQADVYALGAMKFELLVGRFSFVGKDFLALM